MGSAMIIGVAHVIGMKPMERSFFSMPFIFSWAKALAASRGKKELRIAAAVPDPTSFKNWRRAKSL